MSTFISFICLQYIFIGGEFIYLYYFIVLIFKFSKFNYFMGGAICIYLIYFIKFIGGFIY